MNSNAAAHAVGVATGKTGAYNMVGTGGGIYTGRNLYVLCSGLTGRRILSGTIVDINSDVNFLSRISGNTLSQFLGAIGIMAITNFPGHQWGKVSTANTGNTTIS